MTIRFFDPRKLDGRTGARALIFVLGVLLSQWVAIGAMLGMIWLLAQTAANFDTSVSCSFIIFSSLFFTWLLFSAKGLKTQKHVAKTVEKFVFSTLNPRIFSKPELFEKLPCDPDGSLGIADGPFPPPPRISLA
ncbi:hypothetical protein [Limnobacter sp.]|uniref:hypothetical protein n=1 Tax=Limnobacter sp. TaxID=2003368 RepID=UPI0027BAD696|nr:hypothetical protein [Limnobacter sp.]